MFNIFIVMTHEGGEAKSNIIFNGVILLLLLLLPNTK